MNKDTLIKLAMESFTAIYSDDASAVKRDHDTLVSAVSSQSEYTLEEILSDARDTMNQAMAQINKEQAQRMVERQARMAKANG